VCKVINTHTHTQIDDNTLLVFGGLNKSARYNDVWLLDVDKKEWREVKVEGPKPEPRAHFTATLVRFKECIFIFGGYGGSGQVYNDMWMLHYGGGNYRWEQLTDQGHGPCPRFDHSAFIYPVVPNSHTYDNLLVMGGRDLSTMFNDSFIFNFNTMTWTEEAAPRLPYEICNNMCDGIESVPYHKVFSFGGKKGMMQYMNTVEVGGCACACACARVVESARVRVCDGNESVPYHKVFSFGGKKGMMQNMHTVEVGGCADV